MFIIKTFVQKTKLLANILLLPSKNVSIGTVCNHHILIDVDIIANYMTVEEIQIFNKNVNIIINTLFNVRGNKNYKFGNIKTYKHRQNDQTYKIYDNTAYNSMF